MSKNFIEYPKMLTLFKLIHAEGRTRKWSATSGEILPATAPLHFIPFEDLVFTEKIDGTNMGIRFDNGILTHIQKHNSECDRNDKNDNFYFEVGDTIAEKINNSKTEIINEVEIKVLDNIIIYGELCGVKIQKGGNYFDGRRFLVFDIYNTITNQFFTWDAVKYFCEMIGLETVPEVVYDKEDLKVENVKEFILNQKSVYNTNYGAEGIVIRYRKDTSVIKRWMAKIRKKDFKE
jgi:hypothetical protein